MKITYKNWTFLFSQTESAKPTREQSLSCESISADTLTAVVRCDDPTIMAFAKNDPIRVWENDSDASMQTYYLRSIIRTGATSYRLVAWSAVGLLAAMAHKGGIYTGQTVAEVVKEICGDVPVVVKSVFANTKLYGWLPYCQPKANRQGKSARDNLVQVLFAIGAYLTTDLNGVLHIDVLWDGASSTIGSNRMYASGGKVSYSDPVSAVTVTEHQYIAGTDEKELFSGISQQGDIITFSEPMHSLTATGFTILESGANYAKISSGSGSLKGKTYIHNTRLVTQIVTENSAENVKSVTDATLVSFVNSSAVAKRLADYYKCRETITNGIVSGQEKPGHVVSVYHPYDKKMVSACIVSLDTTMSGTLKSEMTALVGFLPPQPSNLEYYDARVVLTGEGDWDPPEGITKGTAVLIGGAQGGWSGHKGNPGESRGATYSTNSGSGIMSSKGGDGGEPGAPGKGGKVLVVDIDIQPGDTYHYCSGVGGPGGVHSAIESVEGSYGTPSTFGPYSSDDGASMDNGYLDVITGEMFAVSGGIGIKGGKGGGVKDGAGASDSVINESGESVTDENGVEWLPGAISQPPIPTSSADATSRDGTYLGWVAAGAGDGLGGGAAAGGNGSDGEAGYKRIKVTTGTEWTYNVSATGGTGGTGGNAAPPAKTPGNIGKGGRGGNGGGGGGGFGLSEVAVSPKSGSSIPNNVYLNQGTPGEGGDGSDGGQGGDGCILLFYRIPKEVKSGAVMDKTGRFVLDRTGRLMVV